MASIIRGRRAPDAGNKLSKGHQFTPQRGMPPGYDGATPEFSMHARIRRIGDTLSETEMHR